MPPANCHDLDQAACRAQPGCVVAECFGCGCAPAFAACLEQGEAPPVCPRPNCPSPPACCRQGSDCPSPGAYCSIQVPELCGTCSIGGDSSCAIDGDCPSGQICDPTPCTCGDRQPMSCQPGCVTDANCAEPARCGGDHRCHARPCDATCSGSYTCDSGNCVRRTCNGDSDCGGGGFCVEHLCAHSLGQCWSPVA